MMVTEDLSKSIAFGELMNSEREVSWKTPPQHPASRKYLTSLPDKYLGKVGGEFDYENWRMADLGTGKGKLTYDLGSKYSKSNIIAVDLASKYAQIRNADHENVTVIGGDVNQILDEIEEGFDFIYAINLLQDVEDFDDTFGEIKDSVRGKGYIATSFPTEDNADIFQEFLDYDEEKDMAYWNFPPIEIDGMEISPNQYLISWNDALSKFTENGLSVEEFRMLEADDDGMSEMNEFLPEDVEMDIDNSQKTEYPFFLLQMSDTQCQ